jgi:hypothetical protein
MKISVVQGPHLRAQQELSIRNYHTEDAYPLSISDLLLCMRLYTICIRTHLPLAARSGPL